MVLPKLVSSHLGGKQNRQVRDKESTWNIRAALPILLFQCDLLDLLQSCLQEASGDAVSETQDLSVVQRNVLGLQDWESYTMVKT